MSLSRAVRFRPSFDFVATRLPVAGFLLPCFALLLSGCGMATNGTVQSNPAHSLALQGSMYGGQQPVSGALLQLYAVGTTGDGSAASPLITATLTTSDGTGNATNANANAGNAFNSLPAGGFTITGTYTCPVPDQQVYLVGTGGNPGLGANKVNPVLAMMTVLGPCSQLQPTTFVQMNELTSVGSLAPIAPYMNGYASLGSGPGDAAAFETALNLVRSYTDTAHGTVPGPDLAPGYYASSMEITTLADILAGCINSDGTRVCPQLFTLATPPGGVAPTDTIGAAIDILKNPTHNAAAIFDLLAPDAPFQPALHTAPAAWALPILPNAATPFISPASGSYALAPSISISDATPGATIYYTTDNTAPTTASSVYTAPFSFTSSAEPTRIVRAFAVAAGFGPSAVAVNTYTLPSGGTGSALAFLTQPVDSVVNTNLPGVRVGIVDAYGNLVADHFKGITLSLAANPGGATLGGTVVGVTGSGDGSFTFTGLSLNKVGNGYTLQATSGGYASAVSTFFNITPTPIVITTPGALIGNGATLTGTFTLPTAAPAGGVTVSLSSSNTAAITVSPATVTLNAGDTKGTFTYTAVGSGTTTLSASAPGYTDGTIAETTTANFITLGTLPTAPGSLQTLALTLSQPAPAGGLTVSLSSSNTAVAFVTSTATFFSGATTPSGNVQVQAKTFGTSTITATGAGYAPDSRVMNVSATAALTQNLTVNKGSNVIETLTLSQASTSATTFTLKSDNPLVATVPSTVIVSANSTSATFNVTGVGVGTTTIHASAAGIADTTASIGVKGTLTLTNGSPAAMLYVPATLNLTSAAVTPVSIMLTSSNPAALLLSGDPNIVGSASITLSNVTGSSAVFYEQGQAAGSATITATSASYTTVTSASIAVNQATIIVQPGFTGTISTLATAPATVNVTLGEASGGNYLGACLGLATTGTNATSLGCKLNPGLSVSVPVLSATTATGTITSSPVTFTGGTQNVTTGFQPVAAGTSVVSVGTMPAGFTATGISTNTAFTVTVAQPTFVSSSVALAAVGVTTPTSLALSIPVTTGITVTVTAANGALLAISADPNAIGTVSLVLPNITNALPALYVQGLAVGPTTLNITATGYKTLAIPFSVVAPGVAFNSGQNVFVNTSDPPYSLPLILIVNGHSCYANGVTTCFLSPGTTNQIPAATFDQNIATVTATYTFAPQSGFAPGSIVGTGAGQAALVLSSTPPAPFTQAGAAGGFGQISIFVTQSKITTQPVITGANYSFTVNTAISAPGGGTRTVSITSGNGAIAVISTNPNMPGSAVATIPNFAGGALTYYVQGISPGTTTLTVSAPGFTTTPVALTVYASGVVFLNGGGTFSTVTTSSPTTLMPYLAEINPATGAVVGYCGTTSCSLIPGNSVTASVTSSNTTTGTISTSQVTFTSATFSATTTFVPNEVGTSTISIAQPAGFTAGTFSSGLATVSGPTILPPDVSLGAGFYIQQAVALSESPATPRSMTVTLADPTLGRLSLDPAVMGTASTLTFDNIVCLTPYCSSGGPPFFYIQGLKPGYTKLIVTMHGYTPATSTVAIYKAGLTLFSASTSYVSEVLPSTGNATSAGIISLLDPYSQSVVSDCLPSSPCNVNPGTSQPTFSLSIADPTVGTFAPVSGAYDPSQFFARIPYTGLKQGLTTFALNTQSAGLYNTTTAGRRMGIAGAINTGDLTYALVIESHDIDAGVGVEVIGNQSLSATNNEVANGLQIVATIADPTIAVLSNSASTVGGISINLPSLNYVNNNFYVQGLKAGTTTITFTGGSYQSRTITVTVRPAGFVFKQFDFISKITNRDVNVPFTPAVLNDAGQWMANAQLNPGTTATMQVTSSNTAAGTVLVTPVTVPANATSGTFVLHPLSPGQTTLTLGASSGAFVQPTTYQSVVATVQ